MRLVLLLSCLGAVGLSLSAGCLGMQSQIPEHGSGGGSVGVGPGAGVGGAGGGAAVPNAKDDGLPCDVSLLLVKYCRGCHSNPPIAGASTSLMTYGELTSPLPTDPSKTLAQSSLERMKNAAAPMPPGSLIPAAELAPFEAWVNAGTPMTTCSTDNNVPTTMGNTPNPYASAPVCTSSSFWNMGANKSSAMTPGRACIACHSMPGNSGPGFLYSGTVYPTAHEPDDCAGIGGATIEITDKNGVVHTTTAKPSGNFYELGSPTGLATPIKARVLYNGKVLAMQTPVDTGDCNTCHTQNGKLGAPGRIILPP